MLAGSVLLGSSSPESECSQHITQVRLRIERIPHGLLVVVPPVFSVPTPRLVRVGHHSKVIGCDWCGLLGWRRWIIAGRGIIIRIIVRIILR